MKTRVNKGTGICTYAPCSEPRSVLLPYFHSSYGRDPRGSGCLTFPFLHPHPPHRSLELHAPLHLRVRVFLVQKAVLWYIVFHYL